MMGKVIWSVDNSDNYEFNINISVYPAGLYYVKLTDEFDRVETKKLIKQ